MKKIFALLQLLRPANTLTAIADIWAGIAISGALAGIAFSTGLTSFIHDENIRAIILKVALLTFSTIGLYSGGTVLNDYFDADLNKFSRPEMPLSSGLITRKTALVLGLFLVLMGIILAFFAGVVSGFISMTVAFFVIFYNVYGKYNSVTGPLSMGLCRGANLLLGISFIPQAIGFNFIVILIPVVFIAAITSLSRYETQGGNRLGIQLAGWLYFLVICYLITMSVINNRFFQTIPFIGVLFYLSFKPITIAFRLPTLKNVETAVRWGILSLVVLNAALAAAFSGFIPGIIILTLLPVSFYLSRHFSLT